MMIGKENNLQMTDKDKIIASLRKQLQEALRKNSALEQEVALLKYQAENSYRVGDCTLK